MTKVQEDFEKWWNQVTPVNAYITEYEFVEMAFKAGYELGHDHGYEEGYGGPGPDETVVLPPNLDFLR